MVTTHAQRHPLADSLAGAAVLIGFGALTGLGARVTIPLPFTPVPFTLQVLFVLLAGVTLGARRGALSQLAYLAAITAGIPLDARALGPAVWLTPTAGYLIGFVAAAYVSGWIAERLRPRPAAVLLGALAGAAALYLVGAGWLTIFFLRGDVMNGILLGIAPFLVVDSIKAAMAALLAPATKAVIQKIPGG